MSRRSLTAPPLGRRYDVRGRRLMLHRSGTGGPAVVFLPGAALVGLDYLKIHDRRRADHERAVRPGGHRLE